MKLRLYGIKSCDSVRKARKFLMAHHINFEMVDFKEKSIACETMDRWLSKVDIDTLLNRRGTTYRTLGLKAMDLDDEKKRAWLCKENMLIKRPVLETSEGDVIVGFDEERYKEILQ